MIEPLTAIQKNTNGKVGKDGFEPPNSEEDRFTVCCRWPLGYLPSSMEPEKGLEPPTS